MSQLKNIEISHINDKLSQPYKIMSCAVYIQIMSKINRVGSSSLLILPACLLDLFLVSCKSTSALRPADFLEDESGSIHPHFLPSCFAFSLGLAFSTCISLIFSTHPECPLTIFSCVS